MLARTLLGLWLAALISHCGTGGAGELAQPDAASSNTTPPTDKTPADEPGGTTTTKKDAGSSGVDASKNDATAVGDGAVASSDANVAVPICDAYPPGDPSCTQAGKPHNFYCRAPGEGNGGCSAIVAPTGCTLVTFGCTELACNCSYCCP